MSRPRTPDRRAPRGARGTTLLECEIAVIMLSVLVVGMVKLLGSHERLVSTLDAWAADEPTLWVHLPEDELRRVLGVPARFVLERPTATEALLAVLPQGPDAVVVESVERQLDKPRVRAVVRRIPLVGETR